MARIVHTGPDGERQESPEMSERDAERAAHSMRALYLGETHVEGGGGQSRGCALPFWFLIVPGVGGIVGALVWVVG